MTGGQDATAPGFGEALRVWARIGFLSFGGPAGQIALMHREIVEGRGWLTEQQFLNAVGFCMLLPGPEAMQIATYAGWRLHGVRGGLAAGLLFVLPGAVVIGILAYLYFLLGRVPLAEALFLGVKAAVVVIVVEALLRVSRKALVGTDHWILAGLAFTAIFFLSVPFPLIIVASALYGFATARAAGAAQALPAVPITRTLRTAMTWGAIWAAPLLALWLAFPNPLLLEVGLFFSKLAVVTFGGAYAVLAYMAQDVVGTFGWLSAGEMLDGLGLAETTPGPLILVTEFVGFLAGARAGGPGLGVMAALLTLWVTFVPCFLWIFVGAPYIAWISGQPRLKGALQGITAAVVGVILNLSVWFSLHVLFEEVARIDFGPIALWRPALETLNAGAAMIAFVSGILLIGLRLNLLRVLGIASGLGLGWSVAMGGL